MLREYVVCLKKGIDYDKFWEEIENESDTDGLVPSRRVEIKDPRWGAKRSCNYLLSEEEAKKLSEDERVYCVELPLKDRTDGSIEITEIQNMNTTRGYTSSYNNYNWGLKRIIYKNDPFSYYRTTLYDGFPYTLDGTGVDVVIMDTGIDPNHEDFEDKNGVSRVQQIDWFAETGISGSMPPNHYSDPNSHGTHVASITAGKKNGWVKNAKIYSLKVLGSDSIDYNKAFDLVTAWHQQKPVTSTGYKRPTVLNMSWGWGGSYRDNKIISGKFRGNGWTHHNASDLSSRGIIRGYNDRIGTRVGSLDVSTQDAIDAGIHVAIAAGNYYQKIDVPGGIDYNNYFKYGDKTLVDLGIYEKIYYNRGSSPFSKDAFIVGNVDYTYYSTSSLEQKNSSSESGPAVDIYAPGSYIKAAVPGNSYNYKTGTSMASPQVAGVMAQVSQAHPEFSPQEMKHFLLINAQWNKLYSTGSSSDFENNRSIKGSLNRTLYNPFHASVCMNIKN